MDFEALTRRRLIYYPNAHTVLEQEIEEAKNAYASQRLLGNSLAAHEVRQDLIRNLRQAKVELRSEYKAIQERYESVLRAIDIIEKPIEWPLWPSSNHLAHEDVIDDIMKVHREKYLYKLAMRKVEMRKAEKFFGKATS